MRTIRSAIVAVLAGLAATAAMAESKGERLDTLETRLTSVERQLEHQGLLEMSRQISLRRSCALRGDFDQLQHDLEQARPSRKTSTWTSTRVACGKT
jgi:hypothetical protein